MKVEDVKIDDVQVGERFRTVYENTDNILQSIKEKGVIQPITITPDKRLIAGGRRLHFAKEAGLTSIPAIVRDVEDEVDLREIELVENICRSDMTWVERCALEARIYELKKKNMTQGEVAAIIGESGPALNRNLQLHEAVRVIPELANSKNANDAWKALNKMKEKAAVREMHRRATEKVKKEEEEKKETPQGRLLRWAEGNYMIGDCVHGLENLNPEICKFAEIDPPYAIDLHAAKRGGADDSYEEVDEKDYYDFMENVAALTYKALMPNSFAICWFGPTHFELVKTALKMGGFTVWDVPAIWVKPNGQTQQPNVNLANCYEPFFICRKGNPVLATPGRGNIFAYPPVAGQAKYHPTQRPIELIDDILNTFTFLDTHGSILVPFLGSGTTLISAYKKNMSAFGWDLSPEFKPHFMARVMKEMENAGIDSDGA